MNIGDLKKLIIDWNLPDDMEILNDRCSDYDLVEESDWSIIEAVSQNGKHGGWFMRAHPTMSEENKSKCKQYLHLKGN